MNLDLNSLGTFSRLASTGAVRASASLSALTGIETVVDVTTVQLATQDDIRHEFADRDLVGVRIGFFGGLEGETVLTFDRDSAAVVVETLLGEGAGDELGQSGIQEIGNIMTSGFIDGWADFLETKIQITPPQYVELTSDSLIDEEIDGAEHVFVFQSQLRAVDAALKFQIHMFPEPAAMAKLADVTRLSDVDTIPIEKLTEFDRLIKEGAASASTDVSMLTGIETDVEVSTLSFVPIEDVPVHLGDEIRIGTVLQFEGALSGYIAILFSEEAAESLVGAVMPGAASDPDMRQSTVQEIGNIMTSGFIDGWANTLVSKIQITPPRFVHDLGSAILDPVAAELAQDQEYAFLINSTIRTDDEEFACSIYALPNEQELRAALDRLELKPAVDA